MAVLASLLLAGAGLSGLACDWGRAGRRIDLHRLTQAWTETGATWNCAEDADPTNRRPDCAGETSWEMSRPKSLRPWVPAPTATQRITKGRHGVLRFDVTADVAAIPTGGGAQYGWLVKRRKEDVGGRVAFGSRESASPPRLVLTVVPQAQDTSRPPVPPTPNLPDDSTFTVLSPSGLNVRYHRNIVVIAFDDSTAGTSVRRILAKFGAVIIGGSEARDEPAYYVRIPDPGATYAAMDSVTSLIEAEPGVKWAANPTWRDLIRIRSRYPQDGPSATRADWFHPTNATRALLAIRAPLAWGCETGTYGTRPKLGVIDWVFNAHRDLTVSSITTPTSVRLNPLTVDDLEHGNKVAGIAAATGNNGEGIAGVAWGSELHLYALGSQIFTAQYTVEEYRKALEAARRSGVRVLTSSVAVGDVQVARAVERLQAALEAYLGAGNVFVYALENGRRRFTVDEVKTTLDTNVTALDRAVARARDRFADRILTVAGTGLGGALLRGSDYWTGGTDILAPGQDILTLAHSNNGTAVADSGNSFAAPYVAGTAALLLAMDPTLPADSVKDHILRGAREPKGWSAPGVPIPATPVAGAPETVYQLDAYGALTLLARERRNTPICGFPVGLSTDMAPRSSSGATRSNDCPSPCQRTPGSRRSRWHRAGAGWRSSGSSPGPPPCWRPTTTVPSCIPSPA